MPILTSDQGKRRFSAMEDSEEMAQKLSASAAAAGGAAAAVGSHRRGLCRHRGRDRLLRARARAAGVELEQDAE